MTETIISTFPEILYQTFNTDLTIIVVSFEVLGLKHEILVKKNSTCWVKLCNSHSTNVKYQHCYD